MKSVIIKTKKAPEAIGPYSQAIVMNNLVYTSGQIPLNPETGVIIDPNHELKGECIKDKVLFIPGGKGSTVGSYVIFQMMKNNTAPNAIICLNAEPIIATGAIMSDIPMVDSPAETKELTNGTLVEVDGDNGTIEIL